MVPIGRKVSCCKKENPATHPHSPSCPAASTTKAAAWPGSFRDCSRAARRVGTGNRRMRILIGSLYFYFISFLFSKVNGFLTQRTSPVSSFPFYNYSYLNLSSVSQAQAPKTARALNFSYNAIEKITKRDFEGFHVLEVLDLSHNHIKDIEPGAFENLLSLVSVDLSFNDKNLLVSGLAPHLKLIPTSGASGPSQIYMYFQKSAEAALEPSAPAELLPHLEDPPNPGNVNPRFRQRRTEENKTSPPAATLRPDLCGAPINGLLDLSRTKLSNEELTAKLDADLCQAQLGTVLEFNISHSDLEMDLLSLFILFLPMKDIQSVDASFCKACCVVIRRAET